MFVSLRSGSLALALAGFGLGLASVATAADDARIDLGTTSCGEFLTSKSNGAARKFYVFWFDGYLAARHGSTVSDANQIQKRLDAVEKACEADPTQKVMPLMEKQK